MSDKHWLTQKLQPLLILVITTNTTDNSSTSTTSTTNSASTTVGLILSDTTCYTTRAADVSMLSIDHSFGQTHGGCVS